MRKSVYQTIISLLILVILVSVIGIVTTEINLRHETDNPKECISKITGKDLCEFIKLSKIVVIVCLILTSGMISFRYKLIKD